MRIPRPPCLSPHGLIAAAVVATAVMGTTPRADGSDVEVSLQIQAGRQRIATRHTEMQPSPEKPRPRRVMVSDPGETLLILWKVTNVSKRETFNEVLIHCFVVAEDQPGQATVPDLKDPEQESALTMDFKPGSHASGRFALKLERPGAYLVRVETLNMLGEHGHEHYAALDLIRKPAQ